MERRLKLLERLKLTKLNKITVKQGGVNVKLNLQSLSDSSVSIDDKVLDMLEKFVTQDKPVVTVNDPEPLNQRFTDPSSPSKRVRFDDTSGPKKASEELNSEAKTSQECKDASNLQPKMNQNLIQESTENLTENENQDPKGTESDESLKKESFCRLCKLKCSNERSLYEHLARIHGGKGQSTPQFISQLKLLNPLDPEDEDNTDEEEENNSVLSEPDLDDELESGEEAATAGKDSSSSEVSSKRQARLLSFSSTSSASVARKKPGGSKQHVIPRPNVAIRVAKVAYYNSKASLHPAANPFKSTIFSNGMRGNFFSQERLPLRSCKIKMKITSGLSSSTKEGLQDDGYSNDFLVNTNRMIQQDQLDKTRTLSVQSSHCEKPQEQLLSEKEIRQFFKSLLTYIPMNISTRIEDLLIEHKSELEKLQVHSNVEKCMRIIHANVLEAKQFGITLFDLFAKTNEKLAGQALRLNQLRQILDILIDNFLVLVVGVVETVYVCHEFKQHWVIQSYKSLKGRGSLDDSEEKEINEEMESKDEETETRQEEKRTRRARRSSEEAATNAQAKNFKQVCLIPRPWRYIDGLLNRQVLKQMLESILLYLKTYPNSSVESICEHYCPVLQPATTKELLEMLERLKCVKKNLLIRSRPCTLLTDFTNESCEIKDEDNLKGNEIQIYCLNQNSLFTFKKVFSG